jgi:hypothetical protein
MEAQQPKQGSRPGPIAVLHKDGPNWTTLSRLCTIQLQVLVDVERVWLPKSFAYVV